MGINPTWPDSWTPLLLSAKIAEEQNVVRKLKYIIRRNQNGREIMTWLGLKTLNLLLRNLTLRYPI